MKKSTFLATIFISTSLLVSGTANAGKPSKPGSDGGTSKSWTHPASPSNHISPVGAHASNPQVAANDNGDAVVTWTQDSKLFKSEYRNGSWTHSASLADVIGSGSSIATSAQVAMNDAGDAIIAWADGLVITTTEYRNGSWSAPMVVSPAGAGAYNPQVAMGSNGDAVIVWRQSNVAAQNL